MVYKRALFLLACLLISCSIFSSSFKNTLTEAENPNIVLLKTDNPITIKLSAITLKTTAESSVFVMLEGTKPMGILIKNCEYTYTFKDRFFLPVAKRNFAACVKGKPIEKNNTIVFKEKTKFAVVWNYKTGEQFANFPKIQQEKYPKKIKHVLEGFLYGHPSLTLIFQQLYPKEEFITVYLDSGKNKLIYVKNPVYLKNETLFSVLPYPFKYRNLRHKYRIVPVAVKTLKKHWFDKETNQYTETIHTEFNLINDDKEHISLKTKQKVKILRNNTPAFIVNLISAIYRKRKISFYRIKSVKVNGQKADYAHLNNILLVKFPKPAQKGEIVEIETETEGNIALLRKGNQRWILGLWAWYPKPRQFE